MAGYPKAVVLNWSAAGQRRSLVDPIGHRAKVPALDEQLGGAGILARRTPMCAHPLLARQINTGSVHYVEQQMNKMPRLIRSGRLGPIDVAVIEALGIDEQGNLIPTTSSGLAHLLIDAATSIIVEINTAQPGQLADLHDVYIPDQSPLVLPVPLVSVRQRIGRTTIPVDPDKIGAIVVHQARERIAPPPAGSPETDRIAQHLFDCLEIEKRRVFEGRLPPLEMGFGSLATSIARSLARSSFRICNFSVAAWVRAFLNFWFPARQLRSQLPDWK
jgi:succinyl-CoA:acetate CoA-transferase